ncbi:hypothetical protein Nepgr_023303 [Nepenthes gracilis]|uniref:Uncharacterized protein n=1 Tax=Nepenthes gracilis TaxID=150966 RepID=A0AAD3T2L4_NEPGR|nr:hypothetical protein Nepgr_023303 [Nepenthes gracilis]
MGLRFNLTAYEPFGYGLIDWPRASISEDWIFHLELPHLHIFVVIPNNSLLVGGRAYPGHILRYLQLVNVVQLNAKIGAILGEILSYELSFIVGRDDLRNSKFAYYILSDEFYSILLGYSGQWGCLNLLCELVNAYHDKLLLSGCNGKQAENVKSPSCGLNSLCEVVIAYHDKLLLSGCNGKRAENISPHCENCKDFDVDFAQYVVVLFRCKASEVRVEYPQRYSFFVNNGIPAGRLLYTLGLILVFGQGAIHEICLDILLRDDETQEIPKGYLEDALRGIELHLVCPEHLEGFDEIANMVIGGLTFNESGIAIMALNIVGHGWPSMALYTEGKSTTMKVSVRLAVLGYVRKGVSIGGDYMCHIIVTNTNDNISYHLLIVPSRLYLAIFIVSLGRPTGHNVNHLGQDSTPQLLLLRLVLTRLTENSSRVS